MCEGVLVSLCLGRLTRVGEWASRSFSAVALGVFIPNIALIIQLPSLSSVGVLRLRLPLAAAVIADSIPLLAHSPVSSVIAPVYF